MIFPEPVNSIASALTLIDYTIRLLKFLSPQVRHALQDAQAELSHIDSNSPADTAQGIVSVALQRRLSALDAKLAERELTHIMDVLYPLVGILEDSQKYERVPEYGAAINPVLKAIQSKLEMWRCFEVWGYSKGLVEFRLLLPAPHLSASFDKCSDLIFWIRSYSRWAKVYLIKSQPEPDLALMVGEEDKYMFSLFFAGHDAKIEGAMNQVYPLKFYEFQLIVDGLLNDLVYYSRLVDGEITAAQAMLDQLKRG
jgi:hypothetical protein